MKQILFMTLFLAVAFQTVAQRTTIGLGLNSDAFTIKDPSVTTTVYLTTPIPAVYLNEYLLFIADEIYDNLLFTTFSTGWPPARDETRLSMFIEHRVFNLLSALTVSVALHIAKQLPSLVLISTGNSVGRAQLRASATRSTFFVPVQVACAPFAQIPAFPKFLKKIHLSAGIGPAFHTGRPLSGRNNHLVKDDGTFAEIHYRFPKYAYRPVTLNYNWNIDVAIFKSLGFRVMSSGSIGSITKPFTAYGETYHVPMRRRSLSIFLTYAFDVNKLTKVFKKKDSSAGEEGDDG